MLKSKSKGKAAAKASAKKPKSDSLFRSTPRNFNIGGDTLPKKRDLGRFVRWPKYVRIQRQRKILYQRVKVPPAINQFNSTIDKNQATELFRLLQGYQPETKAEKKERLQKQAEAKAAGGDAAQGKPPSVVKFGLNHVTYLVEKKKAKLVIIAHDVNPVELVVWLPALCRQMDIPYCIVKGKARLGTLVHQKNATCVAVTSVRKEDQHTLTKLSDAFRAQFNESKDALRRWGGGIMGLKTQSKIAQREAAIEAERRKKEALMA